MRNRIERYQKPFVVSFFALLVFAIGKQVSAGPLPMPLEAHLDLADYVVVGELTQIQETNVRHSSEIKWSRATVTVSETLKGQAAKTLSFLVASGINPNYGGAIHPRIHNKGDSGIWLIKPERRISHMWGLLAESRRGDVKRILKSLAERKWSNQVNGLRAWAGVVQPHYHPRNPVIIFAVKNVSKADIYYPIEHAPGVVSATAESSDKTVFKYFVRTLHYRETVFCRKISPGETVYLHPGYSFIDLASRLKLRPGKYKVIVTYKNILNGESANGPTRRVPVDAWKGELKAPAVELLLLPEKEDISLDEATNQFFDRKFKTAKSL